ncbi:MATE family efflux transporter [Vibrio vulnificus]|uniref:Multidrug resistance protein NorM n=1 Tax=Vibrio vulnificus TaxID=672 RepID=A0ABX4X1F9_VIBVL|nr:MULTISPECIES: MATE family efflux transporter [Vibrio]ASJ40270.1 MATE family efflux transporter [Vibrio vulnificus]ASM98084.1 MATE family efflux transporter [Vibrio vulnificus NBRC 15645 = ATCC 27562]AUL97288.1 MATE family efflux transporter [Vibrio vulnificus]EGQ7832574.1 MATE family efflux transporter [Vibrio vulnificus]EGQ7933097.1 MATE family efflux transporter [Vibrio vulnificus]
MAKTQNINQRMSIVTLAWPILVEILLRTALGTSDVFMLSGYSDKAVSAVGVITQLTFFLIIVSTFVSSGTGILIAQYNGAGRDQDATHVGVASIALSSVIGVILSVLAVLGATHLLPYYGLEAQVEQYAQEYLLISGAMTFNVTIGIVFTTILRSHGYSRSPMTVNLISGVLNIIGNYIALYQPFGLPVYGVQGVAIATVASQVIGTTILGVLLWRSSIDLPMRSLAQVPSAVYKKILKIGGMNAGEVLSYNMAQITIVYFVVQMGTSSLAAFTYAQNIARFSFAFALAIGQATQIQTGYYIGKGWIENITKRVQIYFLVGFASSVTVASTIYFMRDAILTLFTQQPEILMLAGSLVMGSIVLEAGRVFNLIFISALKGAGDIKFPVQMGILSMWGLGVVFSYLLGIHWGYGVFGAWMAIALDEWFRGLIMARRWRSQVWTRYKLS